MLKSNKSFSLIFPVYNESENIRVAIHQAMYYLDSLFLDWEIITVNDGSHDGSGELIETLAQENKQVKVFHHEVNRGYGAALKTGFQNASKELIFFCDSDLQFHLSEILLCLVWIEQYDMVVGYRYKRTDPIHRRLNAYCWNRLVRLVLGLKVRDIDCAFKLFRNRVFKSIQIDAVGAMVNTDILTQAHRMGFKVKEIPITHFPRRNGEQTGANLKVVLKAFRELFELYSKLNNIDTIICENGDRRQGTNRRNKYMPINFKDRRIENDREQFDTIETTLASDHPKIFKNNNRQGKTGISAIINTTVNRLEKAGGAAKK